MVKNCLIASIAYAFFDVLVLFGLASGALGPSPFDLMWVLTFACVFGAMLSILLLASGRKSRFTMLASSLMLVLFGGLTMLNLWCLQLASAAV